MRRVALEPRELGGLPLYGLAEADALGVDLVVSARPGGVSGAPYGSLNLATHVGDDPAAVAENRRRLVAALGAPIVLVRQVHGARVADAAAATETTEADALLDEGCERALGVLVADCVPLALLDPGRAVAVVHAGWRGLAAGAVPAALARFADPARVVAVLGPSISGPAYQVGEEVAGRFGEHASALAPDGPGHWRLDLRAVAAEQLERLGVASDHVLVTAEVTDGGGTFFSDRAERPTGRFALVVRRRP
ncbi:MAG TPA: polyphenol oxidase family protein [Acidimicrobiales bacterium]|nr:polyphenol oxidase family protein [Acidimicrobiales bacterium]